MANDVTAIRFDIKSFDKNFENESNFDSDGFSQSKALIDDIIAREVAAGIPHNRIILGGFSQGGAVTLFTGLQAEHALGGLLVMSSWMPARWRFPGKEPNPIPNEPKLFNSPPPRQASPPPLNSQLVARGQGCAHLAGARHHGSPASAAARPDEP